MQGVCQYARVNELLISAELICLELAYPPMSVAVVDAGAHLQAFARMEGAMLASVDIALKKAATAVLFGRDTELLGKLLEGSSAAQSLLSTNGGAVTLGGGVVLRGPEGEILAGLAVSGGSPAQDEHVARALLRESIKDF